MRRVERGGCGFASRQVAKCKVHPLRTSPGRGLADAGGGPGGQNENSVRQPVQPVVRIAVQGLHRKDAHHVGPVSRRGCVGEGRGKMSADIAAHTPESLRLRAGLGDEPLDLVVEAPAEFRADAGVLLGCRHFLRIRRCALCDQKFFTKSVRYAL